MRDGKGREKDLGEGEGGEEQGNEEATHHGDGGRDGFFRDG